LYVTSMSQPWGDWAPREPEAGGLFAIHDLGVRGVEELRFAG
ncbi:MAG: SMP-30/gluconolactonase/LRE family protein, partial [Proteobacteria bacterium]|nr:SMP-30/gluconolactonase/LRE family protein [Pseudomonadota bacterium]